MRYNKYVPVYQRYGVKKKFSAMLDKSWMTSTGILEKSFEIGTAPMLMHRCKLSASSASVIVDKAARAGIKAQLPFWVIPMAGEALTDDLPGESEIPVV